jgi:hypothetical protein
MIVPSLQEDMAEACKGCWNCFHWGRGYPFAHGHCWRGLFAHEKAPPTKSTYRCRYHLPIHIGDLPSLLTENARAHLS